MPLYLDAKKYELIQIGKDVSILLLPPRYKEFDYRISIQAPKELNIAKKIIHSNRPY